jgi:hypothetical protein
MRSIGCSLRCIPASASTMKAIASEPTVARPDPRTSTSDRSARGRATGGPARGRYDATTAGRPAAAARARSVCANSTFIRRAARCGPGAWRRPPARRPPQRNLARPDRRRLLRRGDTEEGVLRTFEEGMHGFRLCRKARMPCEEPFLLRSEHDLAGRLVESVVQILYARRITSGSQGEPPRRRSLFAAAANGANPRRRMAKLRTALHANASAASTAASTQALCRASSGLGSGTSRSGRKAPNPLRRTGSFDVSGDTDIGTDSNCSENSRCPT